VCEPYTLQVTGGNCGTYRETCPIR
jgi:hypothetical protein